jgi:zinc/manganese transport system permease protein
LDWAIEPFAAAFMQRALVIGLLVAITCSLIGTWVVLRGLSFMGDALAHGVIPGVAVSVLRGVDVRLGAAIAAAVTVAGITLVGRRARLPEDVGIGLLFVGMLSVGVMIISRSGSYSGDLAAILFGAVLGVNAGDIAVQAVAAALAIAGSVIAYRAFLVLAFDERKAQVLGFRPGLVRGALLAMIALAVVSSFRSVGALLVSALLIAPPATAALVVRRVPRLMGLAVLLGAAAVTVGLILSYRFDLAAGPCMAGTAVAGFFAVLGVREGLAAVRHSTATGAPAAT